MAPRRLVWPPLVSPASPALELDPGVLALVVVTLPLLGAGCLLIVGRRAANVGWPVAAGTLTITVVLAGALAGALLTADPIGYRVPVGLEGLSLSVRADGFSGVIVLLDSLLVVGVLAYTRTAGPRGNGFYVGYLIFVACMYGIALTGGLFSLYLFVAGMVWTAAALVATTREGWTSYLALKYLLLGSVGNAIYLLGVAVVLAATGALNMDVVAGRVSSVGYAEPAIVAAFVLMTVGMGINIGLFPLHTWLADAHAGAPDAVSALLSGVIPATTVYAFSRIVFTVFTTDFLTANPTVTTGVLYGAVVTMLAGTVYAFFHTNVKFVLAYSTISQSGLVVVGIAIANEAAIFGAIVQLFGHGVIKAGLCVLAGMFALRFGARSLEEYAGLADRAPIMAVTFAALGVAMIGLPPTVGFVGKWYIAVGALEEGLWLVAALVVVSTLLSLGYVVPFLNQLYFRRADDPAADSGGVTRGMVIAVVLAAVVALAMGVASAWLETVLQTALEELAQPGVGTG